MLADALDCLACPVCGEGFEQVEGALRCVNSHSFDIARQGYANLLPGGARPGTADTPEMLAAREAFLARGHFGPVAREVAEAVAAEAPAEGCVADAGAGTGYYLAAVLDRMPGRAGVALDISKHAARRAARAHPRIASVVCDTWAGLPLKDASAAALLDVFSPRNPAEFARVLRPDGVLVVVTPTPRHIAELVGALGLLAVEERKDERLEESLAGLFEPAGRRELEERLELGKADAGALAMMGPSARHAGERGVASRLASLPDPFAVTVSVAVSVWRPSKRRG